MRLRHEDVSNIDKANFRFRPGVLIAIEGSRAVIAGWTSTRTTHLGMALQHSLSLQGPAQRPPEQSLEVERAVLMTPQHPVSLEKVALLVLQHCLNLEMAALLELLALQDILARKEQQQSCPLTPERTHQQL